MAATEKRYQLTSNSTCINFPPSLSARDQLGQDMRLDDGGWWRFVMYRLATFLALFLATAAIAQPSCPHGGDGYIPGSPPEFEHVATSDRITGVFALKGDYLYATEHRRLMVFDISDPANTRFVTWRRLPFVFSNGLTNSALHVVGNTLVIIRSATDIGFYDISEPACPTLFYPLVFEQLHWTWHHDRTPLTGTDDLLITRLYGDVNAIDLSNPSTPDVVSTYSWQEDLHGNIHMEGNLAFLSEGPIIDYTNPANPVEVGSLPRADLVAVDGTLAAVIYNEDFDWHFKLFDVSDPANPVERGSLTYPRTIIPHFSHKLELGGGYAYFAGSGLRIFDVNDPDNPVLIRTLDPNIGALNMALRGDLLFIGGELGTGPEGDYLSEFENQTRLSTVAIVDVSEPADATLLWHYTGFGTFTPGLGFSETAICRGFEYIAVNSAFNAVGIDVCDPTPEQLRGTYHNILIKDLRNPKAPISTAAVRGNFTDVELAGTTLYGLTEHTLQIFDASVPGELTRINCMEAPAVNARLEYDGDWLYIYQNPLSPSAHTKPVVYIYDVSVPSSPSFISLFELPPGTRIEYVVPAGPDTVIVMERFNSLFYDLTNPAMPVLASSYDDAWEAVVNGSLAYFARGGTLDIIDFSDPHDLALLSSYALPGNAAVSTAYLEDEVFYTINGAINVENPSAPYAVSFYNATYTSYRRYGSYRIDPAGEIFRNTDISLGQLSVQRVGNDFVAGASAVEYAAEITDAIPNAEIFAEVTEGEAWFQVTQGEYLVEAGGITVQSTANPTTEARTGTLTVYAPEAANAPMEIALVQPGLAPAELEVSQTEVSVGAAGSPLSIDITNAGDVAMPWSAALDPPVAWLAITGDASGEDDGQVTLACAANSTTEDRVATLVITAPGAANSPVEITITQAGLAPAQLVLLPEQHEASAAAGTVELTIANPGDMPLNWTAQVFGGAWLRITSGTSGEDNGVIALEYDANPNPNQRTSTVQITANGGELSALAIIRQAGAADPADINGSGSVDAVDVQMIINAVLFGMTDPQYDTTGDNQINAADVQTVINAALGG